MGQVVRGGDPLDRWRETLSARVDPKAGRKKRTKQALIVLALLGGVAFAAGWNPPTGDLHNFSRASDYVAAKESGCTNSGEGCHGSEKEYKDFNAYHPKAKCTTCHEYQGVGCIPCHTPGSKHECVYCHDGSMEGVADVVRLTDPYPKGHYRETTHTAMGTDMEARTRCAEDGEASAACGDCHSRDLRKSHSSVQPVPGSPYGKDLGCGECHNDVRSFGEAEVLTDWKKRTCEACHRVGSSSAMHGAKVVEAVEATSPLRCGETGPGCHDVNDLHALHPDVPKDCSGSAAEGEGGCHNLEVQAHVPTAKTCAGDAEQACHVPYVCDDYSHEKDREVHSPGPVAAADLFEGVPCGACHRMEDDGTSLIAEHAVATSERKPDAGLCRPCHDDDASVDAVADDWADRDTADACSACHGNDGLDAAHARGLTALHNSDSEGCADTGPGCHPTGDLSQAGAPSTVANIHLTCLRCHDWRETDGNRPYDPGRKTCGSGRDCHRMRGEYSPESGVHDGRGGRADGSDPAHHDAGAGQREAVFADFISGVSTKCGACHSMILGVEHAGPARGERSACLWCHDRSDLTAQVVKEDWPGKGTDSACGACHGVGDVPAPHLAISESHQAIERLPDGTPLKGSCARLGCHATADVRRVHRGEGCTISGCHSGETYGLMSCGGGAGERLTSCHVGYSAEEHMRSHRADLSGVHRGVRYDPGRNVGCFGCHATDLRSEHSTALAAGSMEGGSSGGCRVCHHDPDDPSSGAFSDLPKVKRAIADGDLRCVACHASGSAEDGPYAVASAHKVVSTATRLPGGAVWADPLEEWKTALDSPAGGGHNSLSSAVTGARRDRLFPLTSYSPDASTTYTWALPPNSGTTAWLRASAFGRASIDTTEEIRHLKVTCEDCHVMPDGAKGPQGASVRVLIDPEYSQDEYANPTRGLYSQFDRAGTQRVVCFKCHLIAAGSVPGTTAPGGNPVHSRHVKHEGFPPYHPVAYGEKCIDCHVRIPHAWKSPRLLIRTVLTTDGVLPDTYPYIAEEHDGLAGVLLGDIRTPQDLKAASCVTGGCHGRHGADSHPMLSDVPSAAYWP